MRKYSDKHPHVCMHCLKAHRSRVKGAKKPWPDHVRFIGNTRLCPRHHAYMRNLNAISRARRRGAVVNKDDAILVIYARADEMRRSGMDVHVDHVIPLKGKYVSGLHVAANLEIIDRGSNLKKSNKFVPVTIYAQVPEVLDASGIPA